MTYPIFQGRKGEALSLHFCLVRASGSEFNAHHHTTEQSESPHRSLRQWLPSVWQYPFILFPAAPCLFVVVFFYKCSWHFVYLSFKHSAKIMYENKGKKPNHISLVKSVARETIQHHSQNTKRVSRHSKVSSKLLGQDEGCSSNVKGTRYILLCDAAQMKSDFSCNWYSILSIV